MGSSGASIFLSGNQQANIMKKIILPAKVFEFSLFDFICTLGDASDADRIQVDFQLVNFYVPSAIVALLTRFHFWLAQGKEVSILNHSSCSAYSYLQRMDFFKQCGLTLEEDFQRHPAKGRFVPLREITHDTETLSTEIATCMEPKQAELDDIEQTGLFDYFEYSISELANNCVQHGCRNGRNSKAFAFAQYAPSGDNVRVAIADTGVGIRNSFEGSEYYSPELDDMGAIRKALEPNVSCATHLYAWGSSPNMGVGLTLLWDTVEKLGGQFLIVSGEGFLSSSEGEQLLSKENAFDGTLCSFMFSRENFSNFKDHHSLLMKSKTDLGLVKENRIGGTFE
ncbi:MAG: hypothetical protein Q3M30_18890 [Candidatus Electrothrix sp. Rat3]|nr:hypothetical protein [Candidatus Electrothrix rattekaaiensis]